MAPVTVFAERDQLGERRSGQKSSKLIWGKVNEQHRITHRSPPQHRNRPPKMAVLLRNNQIVILYDFWKHFPWYQKRTCYTDTVPVIMRTPNHRVSGRNKNTSSDHSET